MLGVEAGSGGADLLSKMAFIAGQVLGADAGGGQSVAQRLELFALFLMLLLAGVDQCVAVGVAE